MSNNTDDNDAEVSTQDKNSIYQYLLAGADAGPLAPYLSKARWISQSIHPFLDISRVFYAGVPDAAQDDEQDNDNDFTEDEKLAFRSIMKLERGFRSFIFLCKDDTKLFLAVISKISEAAAASRSDDTAKLKLSILTYIHEDPKHGSRFTDDYDFDILVPGDSKDIRGFRHVDTAAHLCPLRLKADFERDPRRFMDGVEDGTIQITDEDFPSFLYETDRIYDEANEDIGLFRGYLLVRVFRHIFTGPLSALNPNMKSNKFKAKKFKLTSVTGRTIAYACVQAYIALSSMSQWGSCDNIFNLQDFYNTVVAMFETDPQEPWVIETLAWWNEQVPGLRSQASKRKKCAVPNAMERTRPNPLERVLAQRARRAEVFINQHQELEQLYIPIPSQPATIQVQPEPLANFDGDADGDQAAEEGHTPAAASALDSGDELQEEAEEQARRHKAEKEEFARQLRKGKAKALSTLARRPSLTVVITNIPATSSNSDPSSSSSRKRSRHQQELELSVESSSSDLTDIENEQHTGKKKPQAKIYPVSKKRMATSTVSKGRKGK